jgi:hypothetical protein
MAAGAAPPPCRREKFREFSLSVIDKSFWHEHASPILARDGKRIRGVTVKITFRR